MHHRRHRRHRPERPVRPPRRDHRRGPVSRRLPRGVLPAALRGNARATIRSGAAPPSSNCTGRFVTEPADAGIAAGHNKCMTPSPSPRRPPRPGETVPQTRHPLASRPAQRSARGPARWHRARPQRQRRRIPAARTPSSPPRPPEPRGPRRGLPPAPRRTYKPKPRHSIERGVWGKNRTAGGRRCGSVSRPDYFAKTIFAILALARDAAFL